MLHHHHQLLSLQTWAAPTGLTFSTQASPALYRLSLLIGCFTTLWHRRKRITDSFAVTKKLIRIQRTNSTVKRWFRIPHCAFRGVPPSSFSLLKRYGLQPAAPLWLLAKLFLAVLRGFSLLCAIWKHYEICHLDYANQITTRVHCAPPAPHI